MIEASAPAKINLGLEILGRRPDGYHDLVTILQTIDLADHLTFAAASDLTLESNQAQLAADPNNLILRAARVLQEAARVRRGAAIRLDKQIPIAAGLGGGSSDAAATLVALNRLWETGLDEPALGRLARRLGADVIFFLHGGTQLATGPGDVLEPLPTPRIATVVVVVASPYPDKTRRLYDALAPDDRSDGRQVMALAARARAGQSIHDQSLPSGFDRVTRQLFPALVDVFAAVRRAGGSPALCGAGPTVISPHLDPSLAREVAERLQAAGLDARCHQTVPARPPWGFSSGGMNHVR